MIKLDTAFNIVSMLLTVKDMAKKTIITTMKIFCLFNISEKKQDQFTSGFKDVDINPQKPIKKTILILNRKDIIKLVFSTLKFFRSINSLPITLMK